MTALREFIFRTETHIFGRWTRELVANLPARADLVLQVRWLAQRFVQAAFGL